MLVDPHFVSECRSIKTIRVRVELQPCRYIERWRHPENTMHVGHGSTSRFRVRGRLVGFMLQVILDVLTWQDVHAVLETKSMA